jgi:hypothetical protein
MDAKFAAEQFERAGNLATSWYAVAENLLLASNVLKERAASFDPFAVSTDDAVPREGRLGAVELMLRGMAVECLLKAVWLAKGNELVDGGKFLGVPGALKTHDLTKIASAVAFVVTREEHDLLLRLSAFSEYGGRYPIPIRSEKLTTVEKKWSSPPDDKVFDGLVSRLISCI